MPAQALVDTAAGPADINVLRQQSVVGPVGQAVDRAAGTFYTTAPYRAEETTKWRATVVAAVPTVAYSWVPVEAGKQVNISGDVDTLMPFDVVSGVPGPT